MTVEESEPLSSLATQLLELERQRSGPGPAVEQRVFDRLVQAQAFLPAAAGAGLAKVLIGAAIGALVGGGAVATWYSSQLQLARSELAVARAVVPAPQPPPDEAPPPASPSPTVQPLPVVVAPPVQPRPKPTPRGESLSEEAALIDQARTALLKNNLDGAAAALAQHQTKFAHGRMVEEREVMTIQVLLGQGKEAEARAAGDRFRKRYPSSSLTPTVEALFERAP